MGHESVMTDPTSRPSDEPLGALAHRLSEQIPELVRSELRLAQAELTEKGKKAGLGIGMFSAAGLLAFFGVATLITTAILALALVLPRLGRRADRRRRPARRRRRRRPRRPQGGAGGRPADPRTHHRRTSARTCPS